MKRFSQKRTKSLVAVFMLQALVAGASDQTANPPLRFVGNSQLPPMISTQHGRSVGLVVDLAYAVAQKAGLSIRVDAMDWAEAQAQVMSGQADALLQVNPNPERAKLYAFSEPLLESSFHLFRKHTRTDIQDLPSLYGKRVGVEAAGFPIQYLQAHNPIKTVVIPDWKTGFDMLRTDQLDAVFVDRWVGEYVLSANRIGGVTVVEPPIVSDFSRIAVKKRNAELLASINSGIKAIEADGTRQRILEKWQAKEVVYLTREAIRRMGLYSVLAFMVLLVLATVVSLLHARAMRQVNRQLLGEIKDRQRAETALLQARGSLEQRVAERTAALRASEQRLRRFYESGLVGVMYWNMNGQITDANDKFLDMIGYTRKEMETGQIDWVNMTPPEFNYLDEQSVAELKATGVNNTPFEKAYIRRDGTRLPIIIASAMLDEKRFNGVAFVLDISTRKQAEEKLLRNEALLGAVLDQMPSGVTVRDARTGNLILSNASAQRLLGPLAESIQEYSTYTAFHHDGRPLGREEWPLARSVATGEVVIDEIIRYQHPNGRCITLRTNASPIRDREGRIVAAVSVFADISDHQCAEDALRASEQRYRTLFDSMQEGFYVAQTIFDDTGKPCDFMYVGSNPAFERLMGLPRDQIVGHTAKELIPDLKPGWVETFSRVQLTGEPAKYDTYSDSFKKHFEAFAFRPAQGQFAVLVTDITERRQAEEWLRHSEEQLRALADSILNLAWWADGDGYITWYNRRWYEYTGTTPEQMKGWGWQSVHDPQALPEVMKRWQASIATGEPFEMTFPLRGADGLFRRFLTRSQPLKDAQGRVVQWFGTNTDVEELKRSEESVRESQGRLKTALQEKDVMLKEIHHRVKNNMQVISSLVNLQANMLEDPALRTVFDGLRDQVRSMALVHEKLYQSENLSSVDFAEYTRSLLNHLWRAYRASTTAVRLTLDLQPVVLSIQTAVPCGLLLNELVTNAIKYAFRDRSNAELTVALNTEPDGNIRLCVRDNGVGLPAGLDWRHSRSLGLQLVQMLGRQLNGTVELRQNNGTAFDIIFKNATQEPHEQRQNV